MDSSILVQPTAKKNSYFPRSYPFPIFKGQSEEHAPFNCIIGHLKDECIEITDQENINLLFTMGFYGKGTLSKSTPKALEDSFKKEFAGNKRKRKSYKKDKKNLLQTQSDDAELEVVVYEGDTDGEETPAKRKKKDEIEVVLSDSNTNEDSEESNDSTAKAVTSSKTSEKEFLQLGFEEAYFLSYGFGCLVVKDKDQPLDLMRLWHKFCELKPTFSVMYTAYHHFRSKGWVVRNGLKYGADFVLYKDGPPFYHSSYAVIVKPVKEKNLRDVKGPGGRPNFSWSTLSGLNRICTHVAKALMILYVIKPSTISENKISTPFCVSQYKLEEVVLNRWVPAENRSED